MESLLKDLKKQVTCSICLDTYTEPKTISCLHTFCCKCLEKHAIMSQRQGKFRCPECHAEIDLPEGNRFDHLPTSFSTRVCRVSSPFDKVVMQVALLVPIAEKPTLRCTIALIADDSCAWIVSMRINC